MNSIIIPMPFTQLKIVCDQESIVEVNFLDSSVEKPGKISGILEEAKTQVERYLAAGNYHFKLPLMPAGTEFQKRVWALLQAIPPGQVKTYGELAGELGSSPRAVGNACRANPVPLFIPCHRVVSRTGIGGFAGDRVGGRVRIKQQLLAHEGLEF